MAYRPGQVELEVTDDGRPGGVPAGGEPAGPRGGGHGIAGMRERAAAFGGQVSAGPLPGGGWRVRTMLRLAPARRPAARPPPGRMTPWTGPRRRAREHLDPARRRPAACCGWASAWSWTPRTTCRWSARPATAPPRCALAAGLHPDVVLMDVRMPGHGRHRGHPPDRRQRQRAARVLILTTFDLDEYAYAGAAGRRQRLPAQGRPARTTCCPRSARSPAATPSSRPRSPGGCSTRSLPHLPGPGRRPEPRAPEARRS